MSANLFSLHIGVNKVDAGRYHPTRINPLCGCINDAYAMANIACAHGFTVLDVLLDDCATFKAVTDWLGWVTKWLNDGDAFFFTFSGHGARISAQNRAEEIDKYDEGFVLYDLILKDNYLDIYLRQFKPGVKVIIVADCCHSRTIYSIGRDRKKGDEPPADDINTHPCARNRWLKIGPEDIHPQKARYKELDLEYEQRGKGKSKDIDADLIVMSACDDNERALDGPEHGRFTQHMLDVLRSGADGNGMPFTGSYTELIEIIQQRIGNTQVPGVVFLGPNGGDNPTYPFFRNVPFKVFN